MSRTLDAIGRQYHARAGLDQASPLEEREHAALESYRKSLPAIPSKTYLGLALLAIFVIAQIIGRLSAAATVAYVRLGTPTSPADRSAGVNDLIQSLLSLFRLDASSARGVLTNLFSARPGVLFGATLLLVLSVYVVLRPLVPAFRLKRMFFNLHPDLGRYRRSTTARWHIPQAVGVYELEAAVFRDLGARGPRELPFDLIVMALPMTMILCLSALVLRFVRNLSPGTNDVLIVIALLYLGLCLPALLRMAWLWRAWRRRLSGKCLDHPPHEVRIRGSAAVAIVEGPWVSIALMPLVIVTCSVAGAALVYYTVLFFGSPFTSGWGSMHLWVTVTVAALLLVFFLGEVHWWYRVNRELRDLGRARGVGGLGRFPSLAVAAVTFGWGLLLPPFITANRTCRRVQVAQEIAGMAKGPSRPWLLAPAILPPFSPVLFGVLQAQLNAVWAVEGEPGLDAPARSVTEIGAGGGEDRGRARALVGTACGLLGVLALFGFVPTVVPAGAATSEHRITSGPRNDVSPAWSRDDRAIAFAASTAGSSDPSLVFHYHIYAMNADGSSVRQLTSGPRIDFAPSWSPDGRKIAFEGDTLDETQNTTAGHVYVMNADGSSARPLTSGARFESSPSWSPDGTKITFGAYQPSDGGGGGASTSHIYVMNADGSSVRQLTSGLTNDFVPSWSPDGMHIAFQGFSFAGAGDVEDHIYVMNADGSSVRQLTSGPTIEGQPAWSPDGTQLAFSRTLLGRRDYHIFTMNSVDGSSIRQLTWGPRDDYFPSWSHDGQKIAFARLEGLFRRQGDIYAEDLNPSQSGAPAQPRGKA